LGFDEDCGWIVPLESNTDRIKPDAIRRYLVVIWCTS
jgi:hypothetical protein